MLDWVRTESDLEAVAVESAPAPAPDAAPRTVVDLVPGLGAREIDRELRLADRQTDTGARRLAFYLADMEVRGICQLLGFPTATAYAVTRLEMGRRHAQQLIAVGRALEELPKIDAAFCDGRLNWTRVRLLTKIAVSETEGAWLERALLLRLGDFEREVLTSERGRPPRKGGKGLPQVKIGVAAKLDRLDYEKWELAKRKLTDETGDAVTDADLMRLAADLLLSTRRDGTVPGRQRVNDSNYRVCIDLCSNCDEARLATLEGKAEIPKATFERIACDAKVEDLRGGAAAEEAPKADPTPQWMRTMVLVRDRFTCVLCARVREIQGHHVVWRSDGGPTRLSNLACLCSQCHELVHEKLIVITGEAPHRLVVTDRDGRPLGRSGEPIGLQLRNLRPTAAARALHEGVSAGMAAAPAALPEITFDAVPRKTEADWFERHTHLFKLNAERGEMIFEAGCAIEPEKRAADGGSSPALDADGRPLALASLIGQTRVVEGLSDAIAAARIRSKPVDHLLLLGEAGLGKTTLARAVANEMGSEAVVLNGPAVKDAAVLVRVLAGLSRNAVLFIDEIHGLSRPVAECLYDAMEDGVLRLAVTDGRRSRSMEVALRPFTLIGATTELGRVPAPFVSRFTIREHLDLYETADLGGMVGRAVARDCLKIEDAAAFRIAGLAHGIARDALKLARRVQGLALARRRSEIDAAFVETALRKFGIDSRGLGPIERKALRALEGAGRGRAMGLARWSAASGLAVSVLRGLEPLFVRLGLVAITSRGRMALSEGKEKAAA
jgi:holliday junction DNA helicase RuvB